MKNVKLPILSLSLVLLIASCKKEDFQENSLSATSTEVAAEATGWTPATQWQTAAEETFSVHYFTIDDAAITSDIADGGLVLLFKKNGNAIQALPFEEATATTEKANYWYHQVTEGSLLISCDAAGGAAVPDAANSFKYFVITPEKLKSLEAAGHSNEALMNLSYADAASLLNTVE